MWAFTWDEWNTFWNIFWISETNVYAKPEGLGVVSYIGVHVSTLAPGGTYHEEKTKCKSYDVNKTKFVHVF